MSPKPIQSIEEPVASCGATRALLDQRHDQKHQGDADGHVDEEYPAPLVVVGNPATEGGPHRRRDDGGDAVDGARHPALLGWKAVRQDGLAGGLQAAAGCALQRHAVRSAMRDWARGRRAARRA